jgi:tRNA(adenine34) deaminase
MSVVDRTTTEAMDAAMMARCIELSKTSKQVGEFPFACVIAKDGEVIVETLNRVARDGDVTRHAEIVAIGMAQKALGTKDLSGCTLYTNVEPCGMCSYCIRETRIRKVVYAIRSPIMGGYSKWKMLQDNEISGVIPQVFGPVPEIAGAVMREEAEAVWRSWRPLVWKIIKLRGLLGGTFKQAVAEQSAAPAREGFLRRLTLFHR